MRFVFAFLALWCSSALAATYDSDGTSGSAQTLITAAVAGDIITVPAGSHSWTSQVAITKGVHLRGAGSGRVVARSTSSVAFGTGSKSWTIQNPANGLPIDATISTLTIGTVLRGWRLGTDKDVNYILGTITSLVGTTLTLNVTTSTGSGTHPLWRFATEHATKVTHNAGASALISISEDTAASVKVSGIQFTTGTGTGRLMEWNHTAGGQPILLHDNWWNQSISSVDIVKNNSTNRGIIWNCSVTWTFIAQSNSQFFHSPPNDRTESWTTPSTMGMADADGKQNIYIEDSDIHGNTAAACDFDSNTRAVYRYNLNDHAALNSHGFDSSAWGVRHIEYYRNRFEFTNYGDSDGLTTIDSINHILLRGGTGAIHNNYIEDIASQAWGDKQEFQFGIWALTTSNAPSLPWSNNDSGVPERFCPRQFGVGWIDGTSLDGHGNSTANGLSVGDREPLYIWANTGFTPVINITAGSGGALNPDSAVDYIRAGIEYFNDGTPKPGYAEKEHPHPLRTDVAHRKLLRLVP